MRPLHRKSEQGRRTLFNFCTAVRHHLAKYSADQSDWFLFIIYSQTAAHDYFHPQLNRWFSQMIVWSENDSSQHSGGQGEIINFLFCPNPQNIQFAIMLDQKERGSLTFINLEPANVWHLSRKNDFARSFSFRCVLSLIFISKWSNTFTPVQRLFFLKTIFALNTSWLHTLQTCWIRW